MRKSGVCLSMLILLGSFCFSTASRAGGFLELLFNAAHQTAQAHEYHVDSGQPRRQYSAHDRHVASRHGRDKYLARQARARARAELRASSVGHVASGPESKLSYAATPAATKNAASDAQQAIAQILREDRTLRSGDAVMTQDGLQVFVGDGQGDSQFMPVDRAQRIDKDLKARLAAVETDTERGAQTRRRGDPATRFGANPEPKKAGREQLIETPGGKTIRLVGGYAN